MATRYTVYVKVVELLEDCHANIFNVGKHPARHHGHPGNFLDAPRNQGCHGTNPASQIGLGWIACADGAGHHVRYFFNYDGLI